MAQFNESLSPRYNELIRRLHSMKGGPPAPQVTPEISHTIIIGNDRFEHLALGQERPWVFYASVVANVGGVGQIELLNPASSNLLVRIDGIKIQGAAAGRVFRLTRDPAAAGTPVANTARDDRVVGQIACQNRILNTGAAPSGVTLEKASGPLTSGTDDVFFYSVPYVVLPSHRIAVFDEQTNELLAVMMWGVERHAEESELNP